MNFEYYLKDLRNSHSKSLKNVKLSNESPLNMAEIVNLLFKEFTPLGLLQFHGIYKDLGIKIIKFLSWNHHLKGC